MMGIVKLCWTATLSSDIVNGNGTVDQDAPLGIHRDDMAVPQDQVDPLSVQVHVCLTQVLIDR
jgi:hypothetical protein